MPIEIWDNTFLVTDVSDIIVECINLIIGAGITDKKTIREFYDAYLHPYKMPTNDKELWDALCTEKILNLFQFDSLVGSQAIKKIKPHSMDELADANGLMRLMASKKGAETPMEKYVRYKNNIDLWYREMYEAGLTLKEQKVIEPYFKPSYGVPPSQEALMQMLMDPDICDFTLAEANAARKVVGKKLMSKIPELKAKVLKQAKSPALGDYIWTYGVGPQMGYSFSIIHAKAYSYIGFQTLYLSKHWPSIFWNTACLIINSGSLEEEEDENATTDDKKKAATNYAKISQAISEIRKMGVEVSLVDINTSDYSFKPDVINNTIRYGFKGLSGVGDDIIEQIIANRPYTDIANFMSKCKLTKTAMISLIKAGAFDNTDGGWAQEIYPVSRVAIMAYYLDKICDKKSRITLQNFNSLYQRGLIPQELNAEVELYFYNKFLKDNCKVKEFYRLGESALTYFAERFDTYCLIDEGNDNFLLPQKSWEKFYDKGMNPMRDWMKQNQEEILTALNNSIFMDEWAKYASGTIPAWEMKSLGFYYSGHELSGVNPKVYGITNFNLLPENPIPVEYRGKYPIFDIVKIMGTVIAKNKDKAILTLTTTDGNVNVKFSKEYFAMINRKITEPDNTGKQKTLEDGWTTKGTKLLINGYRREDTFVAKSYTGSHTVYKIVNVYPNGTIDVTHTRAGVTEEND